MAPKFQKGPDVKRFMDKRIKVSLNGKRKIVGTLRGYDAFLNLVLEDATVDTAPGVVTTAGDSRNSNNNEEQKQYIGKVVIRGNSIIQMEGLERIA